MRNDGLLGFGSDQRYIERGSTVLMTVSVLDLFWFRCKGYESRDGIGAASKPSVGRFVAAPMGWLGSWMRVEESELVLRPRRVVFGNGKVGRQGRIMIA